MFNQCVMEWRSKWLLGVLVVAMVFLMGTYAHGKTISADESPHIQVSGLMAAASSPLPAKKDSSVAQKTSKKVKQLRKLFSFSILISIILVIVVTYFLIRLLARILDNLSERASKYRLLIKRMVPVARILLWTIALYVIIAGIINPPFKTVLAVAASVGIAVGLASQDIVKNIFGGFMIILDKPFQVGDKIKIGEHYGEVKQVGLRSTRIFTPDDSMVSVPNGDAISKSVSNMNSGNLYGLVVAEMYLPARTDVTRAKQIAHRAALSSPYVYLNKPIVVIAQNEVYQKNFVLKLRVKAYVLDIRFEFPFRSDMTEQILEYYNNENGIPPVQSA